METHYKCTAITALKYTLGYRNIDFGTFYSKLFYYTKICGPWMGWNIKIKLKKLKQNIYQDLRWKNLKITSKVESDRYTSASRLLYHRFSFFQTFPQLISWLLMRLLQKMVYCNWTIHIYSSVQLWQNIQFPCQMFQPWHGAGEVFISTP